MMNITFKNITCPINSEDMTSLDIINPIFSSILAWITYFSHFNWLYCRFIPFEEHMFVFHIFATVTLTYIWNSSITTGNLPLHYGLIFFAIFDLEITWYQVFHWSSASFCFSNLYFFMNNLIEHSIILGLVFGITYFLNISTRFILALGFLEILFFFHWVFHWENYHTKYHKWRLKHKKNKQISYYLLPGEKLDKCVEPQCFDKLGRWMFLRKKVYKYN